MSNKYEDILAELDGNASAQPVQQDPQALEDLLASYEKEKEGVGTAFQKGLASNIAATVAFVPDALGAAYNLVKSEDMPKAGSLYNYLTQDVTDARIDPNVATEAEKAAYYGAEGIPLFGLPSMYKSAAGMGAKQGTLAATRQTATDVGVGYLAGRAGEENPWLGLGMAAGGGVAATTLSPFKTVRDDIGTKQQKTAMQQSAKALETEFGIQETKGMAAWRVANEMAEGPEKIKARAYAIRLLNAELAGRVEGTGTAGALNVGAWTEADRKRVQQVEAAIRSIAGIADTKTSTYDLTADRDAIYDLYKVWKQGQLNSFRAANKADFDKVDKSATFSSQPTVDVLTTMMADPDLSDANIAMLKRELDKYVKYDADNNIEAYRAMNLETVKDLLSEYGKLAYGKGDRFKDLPAGKQTYYGSQLLKAMNATLDSAGDKGEALKTARANFAQRVKTLQEDSNRPLIKFFDEAPTADPKDLANLILMNGADKRQMLMLKSALSGANKEGISDPELYNRIKEQVFRQMFTSTQIGSGQLDLKQVVANIGNLQDNVFFFDDKGRLEASKKLFKELDGVLASETGKISNESDLSYLKGKMGAEALGAAAGAKGRYVGELAVKQFLFTRLGQLPPEKLALMANDPSSTSQLIRYLKNPTQVAPNTAQIKAAQNLGLTEWATRAGQVNAMFQREE